VDMQPGAILQWWDQTTKRLVEVATVAFIFLLLPQMLKNGRALAAGNAAALAGLAWEVSQPSAC
jgi:hypothetical protein